MYPNRNRSKSLTISASGVVDDYIINRKVLRVFCDPTNLGAVTVNGEDSYGPGYFGPGSGVPLASITGTVGDKVTVMVDNE